ncbi:MAG: DUF4399 domain-containing protein [Thermoanaerobaculia bacterium]|nr:DUF4399 domain-containing protein [Thermoanaerobaculia bacterium]
MKIESGRQNGLGGRWVASLSVLCVLVALSACAPGGDGTESQPEASEESMQHAEHEEATAGEPRVFFVSPEDGATVTSPVELEFGAENFTIEPVDDGEIHHGAGHYHIGVNTDCLDPGIVIPQAAPWVHFGDGSSEIEMQLPEGETKLTLQIGDGEHRTLEAEGLCQSITVNVVEGEAAAEGSAASESGTEG